MFGLCAQNICRPSQTAGNVGDVVVVAWAASIHWTHTQRLVCFTIWMLVSVAPMKLITCVKSNFSMRVLTAMQCLASLSYPISCSISNRWWRRRRRRALLLWRFFVVSFKTIFHSNYIYSSSLSLSLSLYDAKWILLSSHLLSKSNISTHKSLRLSNYLSKLDSGSNSFLNSLVRDNSREETLNTEYYYWMKLMKLT